MNASVERNLNHFIVYLIIFFFQICVVFSVHDGEVLCLGVHDLQQRESWDIFRFPENAERYVRELMEHNF